MTTARNLSILALSLLPLQAQEVSLNLDAGLAFSLDHDWKAERDTSGSAGVVTKFPLAIEGALVFPVRPGAIRAALRIAVDDPFSNVQLGADWIHTFRHTGQEALYGSAGLTFNNVSGRIEVVPPSYIYVPNDRPLSVPGVYEKRSQSMRPGLRFGIGYAFTQNFAFETAANLVTLQSTGTNGFLHSSSVYLTLTGSYRIPKIFSGQ